jgi:structure-specific recognition protein 1
MFPNYLRLRGKTYDYKVVYSSIIKLFLLPKPDDHHVLFVVSVGTLIAFLTTHSTPTCKIGVDPPLRQGQTRYPFLVMQFDKDEEIDVALSLDE